MKKYRGSLLFIVILQFVCCSVSWANAYRLEIERGGKDIAPNICVYASGVPPLIKIYRVKVLSEASKENCEHEYYAELVSRTLFVPSLNDFRFIQEHFLGGLNALSDWIDKNSPELQKIDAMRQAETDKRLAEEEAKRQSEAEKFCQAVEQSKVVRDFVGLLAKGYKYGIDPGACMGGFCQSYRTESELLKNWVRNTSKANGGRIDYMELDRWAMLCMAKHVNDDLFNFFTPDRGANERLREQFRNATKRFNAQPSTRIELDAAGKPVQMVVPKLSLRDEIKQEGIRFELNRGNWTGWAAEALTLPNGEQALESSASETVDDFRGELDKKIADYKRSQSPTSKLSEAYKYMALIDQCVEERKGFALVYVNEEQHAKSKKITKQIEDIFKNKLQGITSKQLWEKAAAEADINAEFNRRAFWNNGVRNDASVCQDIFHELVQEGVEVAGKKISEKAF